MTLVQIANITHCVVFAGNKHERDSFHAFLILYCEHTLHVFGHPFRKLSNAQYYKLFWYAGYSRVHFMFFKVPRVPITHDPLKQHKLTILLNIIPAQTYSHFHTVGVNKNTAALLRRCDHCLIRID